MVNGPQLPYGFFFLLTVGYWFEREKYRNDQDCYFQPHMSQSLDHKVSRKKIFHAKARRNRAKAQKNISRKAKKPRKDAKKYFTQTRQETAQRRNLKVRSCR
jgi:hypothetical protein